MKSLQIAQSYSKKDFPSGNYTLIVINTNIIVNVNIAIYYIRHISHQNTQSEKVYI